MNIQMKILKEVAIKADGFREQKEIQSSPTSLGEVAFKAFGSQHKSQIKNLENIANSALKISDVLDYIKRQTGRAKEKEGWRYQELGKRLLQIVEGDLAKSCDDICQNLKLTDEVQKLEVRLLLTRELIRQMVIHYEYKLGG